MSTNKHVRDTSPADAYNNVASRIYSIRDNLKREPRKFEAIVLENYKPSDGNKIRVMLTELLPLSDGHITDNPVNMSRTYKDAKGIYHKAKGIHNNNITCEYYSTDSYRKTPPDVQANERVLVWQKGDSTSWYWEPCNSDAQSLRRLETVVHSVNADEPKGPAPNKHTHENTYYTEMSSHNKTYTISTSKANGEKASYTIQINAGEGAIYIADDLGNHIELDTVETKIWMRNAFKTEVTCIKNDIYLHCNENYKEIIGSDQDSEVKGNKTVTVSGNVNIIVNGSADIKVDGGTTLTSPNTKIEGNVEITGNTVMQGNLAVKGALTASGGSSLSGGGTADSLTVTGPVTLNGGTSSAPIWGSYIDT